MPSIMSSCCSSAMSLNSTCVVSLSLIDCRARERGRENDEGERKKWKKEEEEGDSTDTCT